MLKGIDISHHNKWQKDNNLLNFNNHEFIICKATEGKNFIDPMLDTYMEEITKLKKPYGLYHYARPEKNDAITEAKHFCNTIGEEGRNGILALDWEDKATKCDIKWALEWLRYVEKVFNKKPLIYCSSWYTKNLKPIYENGNGLWVAHYTKNKPKIQTYPFYTIWQYSSDPYDKNIFNGSIEQFKKYI